jgi:hypothetical protein
MSKTWSIWVVAITLAFGGAVAAGAEDSLAAGAAHGTPHHSHKKGHPQAHSSSSTRHKTHAHPRSTHASASAHTKPAPTAVR